MTATSCRDPSELWESHDDELVDRLQRALASNILPTTIADIVGCVLLPGMASWLL